MKLLLSVDGGGIKGVAVSQFLYRLEKELGKPLFEVFDMYAGTSTGALIISAIGYNKYTGDDLIHKLYTPQNAKKIMNKSCMDKIFGLFQTKPKYDGKGKREIIRENIGTKRRIDDSNGKDIMITSFNIDTQKPLFFKSWDPYGSSSGGNVLILDAADASSAAPGYFPSVKINTKIIDGETESESESEGEFIYCTDGSVVVKNPTDCMYVDMKERYPDEEIRILSIGTGKHVNNKKNGNLSLKWGTIEWATEGNLLDIIMSSESVDYRMKSLTKEVVTTTTNKIRHKYIRVDGYMENDSLDDVSDKNLKKLKEIGDYWWAKFGKNVVDIINLE